MIRGDRAGETPAPTMQQGIANVMRGTGKSGSNHLLDLVENLGSPRILVLGDAILDRYIWGDAERVSQEAPVILLRADHDEIRLGGAANVANMVRGFRAAVTLVTVVGNDAPPDVLLNELERFRIDSSAVVHDPGRPPSVKEQFI